MIQNYFKIAWRSLKKQPFFTFINIFGLSIGIAGALLISLYIFDDLSFNRSFKDAERIHRANVDIKFGGQAQEFAVLVAPFAETVKSDFDVIEDATRFRTNGSMLVRKSQSSENQKEESTTYADPNFIDFFGLSLLEGDASTALKEPNTVVLSSSAAKKHFGQSSPIGESILVNNNETFRVTGVIPDLPNNSFLKGYSVFMSMEGYPDAKEPNWGSNNFNTFLKLIPSANADDLQKPLQILFEKYMVPFAQAFMPGITRESFESSGNYIKYSTIPLLELHLAGNRIAEMNPNGNKQTVYILSFIGLFLLLLAIVNFMNLSTAQSLKRAKEVGIRKTLGSNKSALVFQFLAESTLLTFISLTFALLIAFLIIPLFNQLSGKTIELPFFNPFFWLTVLVATLGLGFISGSYPSFFLSRFVPVEVLKGNNKTNVGGVKIRNTLVVFQFAISVFLIISTLVVFQQLNFIQNKDLGYKKDQILVIDDVYTVGNKLESFKREVSQLPNVTSASLSSFLPTPSSRSDNSFESTGAEAKTNIQMQYWGIDHDYVKTLDMEIIEGRDFDENFPTDSVGIILNETAVGILGLKPSEAIGKQITTIIDSGERPLFTVIGVVKNFHYSSFKDDIGALCLRLDSDASSLIVKLNSNDFNKSLSQIEKKWTEVAPGQPFNHYFMDDSFNNTFEVEQKLGRIFMTFTILSLLIACLGLFGLAAYNAQLRTKEIGIRKVMGASVSQITYRLTKDFLKLVAVAIIIALPIGWYTMNRWLEDFTFRIDIPVWIYVLATISAIIISIMTVSYQSIKAALVNPVKSLKTE
jgi:putative ABC transport system permease protein